MTRRDFILLLIAPLVSRMRARLGHVERQMGRQGTEVDRLARELEVLDEALFAQELRLSRLAQKLGSDDRHHPPMPEYRRKERMET